MSGYLRYPFAPPEQTTYPAPPSYSDGPASRLEETEHPQVPRHLTNTGGFDSSSEANQFVLLECHHDPDSLGQLIHEHAAISSRVREDQKAIASKFHEELKEFASHLAECKKRCGLSRNPPERRRMLEVYAVDGDSLITSVQALIEVSEGAMQTVPFREDGTPTQEAWDAFMKSLLGSDHQLQETLDLIKRMDGWVFYYKADCSGMPFVFLGREVDAYGFTQDLIGRAEYLYERDNLITEKVRGFSHQLMRVNEEVVRIMGHKSLFKIREISRRYPRARDLVNWLMEEQEALWARIRDFIAVCEAAVQTPYRLENGSLPRSVVRSFMHALVGQDEDLRELGGLTWDLYNWLKSYDTACAPFLERMQQVSDSMQRRF